MKKTIALFMVLVVCISLCACGIRTAVNPYAKYEELFEYLEANDYDGANAYIQNYFGKNVVQPATEPIFEMPVETEYIETEPAETEPQYRTIEITLDNWQDYFELKTLTVTHKNGFNEIDYFFPQLNFLVRDEWASMMTDMNVVFEYTCTDSYACWFTYNMDTEELVEGEKTDHYVSDPWGTISTLEKRHIEYGTWLYGNSKRETLILEGNIAKIVADMYSTVEILRIEGTITIAE